MRSKSASIASKLAPESSTGTIDGQDAPISHKETRRLKKLALLAQQKSDIDSASETESDAPSDAGSDDFAEVYQNNPLLPGPSYDDESDSSDEEDLRNTIGNVPVRWYDEYDHIGYDHEGRQIEKKSSGRGEIDEFLARMEDPDYWRTVKDRQTGGELKLTDEQVAQIANMQRGRYPAIGYNPFEPYIDFFSNEVMQHPVTQQPEHKRSFIPSRLDARRVGKLVYAMKMGWIKPTTFERRRKPEGEEESFPPVTYDLWEEEGEDAHSKNALNRLRAFIPAPQMALPGHVESFNPPREYLFDEEEKLKWESQEADERETSVLPAQYSFMRRIPGYGRFLNERNDRCMDLFLAPRQRKMRLNVKPEDLLPPLPKPSDLQPFPAKLSSTMHGHSAKITGLAIEPITGNHCVTCSSDGVVRVWHVAMGICVRQVKIGEECKGVVWMQAKGHRLVAVAAGCSVYLLNLHVGCSRLCQTTDKYVDTIHIPDTSIADVPLAEWSKIDGKVDKEMDGRYVKMRIKMNAPISGVTAHIHGDYLATVTPSAGSKAVTLHQISKMKSQAPFAKSKGDVQVVDFHRTKPWLFVVTKEHVRIYDLVKQSLVKKMMTNCKAITSLAVHPGGDNLLVGSGDSRVTWLDLDLSSKPYKTLRHHKADVRSVAFHDRLPLFATASDDGTVLVCHGNVYNDLMTNALIVPVKSLSAPGAEHVTKVVFHPRLPWLLTANSDHTLRLYVY